MTHQNTPLSGGELLSAITTRIVKLLREHYGRGPTKAKTYVLDDLVVVVIRDGLIPIEKTMIEGGEEGRVLNLRRDFQEVIRVRYSDVIEELTGRKVIAFLSQTHVDPDVTLEVFLVDGSVPGFGALELVDPADTAAEAMAPAAEPAAETD
jgi:uncharacterized protein YbcI